ncbi:MAG: molybdopterin molybdotransferase MoeA [Cyclobacteriaceae bacterium]|nr:molybdopterin molybdotransferase MoeA [Cyclobacteriaceae bacterium HetDA_MAG_MS6]
MISVEEAISVVLSCPLKHEVVRQTVASSLGWYLAEDILAPIDLPSFDNSAMDGYAVCGLYRSYELIGEVAAGGEVISLSDRQAVRIFTGAPVPHNCSAVVIQEKVKRKGDMIFTETEPQPGQHIRRRGEQMNAGQSVFAGHQQINPSVAGLLHALGQEYVDVFQKPRVAIITTGDEVVEVGQPLEVGQIYNTNQVLLAQALEDKGFETNRFWHVRDDFGDTKQVIAEALESCDVILISGGISVGDHDHVRRALIANQVEEYFYRVNQKPGKPLYFGQRKNHFVFALPGNPASTMTCFYMYALPLLRRFAGSAEGQLLRMMVPLAHSFSKKEDRPTFYRAVVGGSSVSLLSGQSSSMLYSFAHANALVFLDEAKGELTSGAPVLTYSID